MKPQGRLLLAGMLSAGLLAACAPTAATQRPAWSAVSVVSKDVALQGIACAGHGLCFAVGSLEGPPGFMSAVVEKWNGSNWVMSAVPRTAGSLDSIACPSANYCLAAGIGPPACPAEGPCISEGLLPVKSRMPVLMSWEGGVWKSAAAPGSSGETIEQVACQAPGNCLSLNNSGLFQLSAGTWRSVHLPFAPVSVACGPSVCLAAGAKTNQPVSQFMGAVTSGGAWKVLQDVGAVPVPSSPVAMSCPGKSGCVIFWNNASSAQIHELLVANGEVVDRIAASPVARVVDLGTSLWCSTTSSCMVAGTEELGQGVNGTGARPEVVNIVGSHISSEALPLPVSPAGLASQNASAALACETTSYCLAVGTSYLQEAGLGVTLPQRAFADAIR